MAVQPSQVIPSTAMAITIIAKLLLLLSQSPLTNPLSGPLLRSQGRIFYSGSPQEKARLISEEGSVHQSTNLSIVHTEFNKSYLLQRVTISCYLHNDFRINVKHSQFKQYKL